MRFSFENSFCSLVFFLRVLLTNQLERLRLMLQDKEQAKREALHWLIALQEDPDDNALKDRFDNWLMANDDHAQAWNEAQRVWQAIGSVAQTPKDNLSQYSGVSGRRSGRGAGRSRWRVTGPRFLVSSAVIMTAICLAVFMAPTISIWFSADFSTSVAQTRDVTLEDGSIVHLGADSAISISFDRGARVVQLLSGEAYFDVQPDVSRPFRVRAGDVETTVLGTAFDVVRTGGSVTVAVNHGMVAVAAPQTHEALNTPLQGGDWVRISPEGMIERGNDEPDRAGAWRTGMLVVKDQPVSDVVDVIRRHYAGKIMSVDAGLGERRVTGVYDLKQPIEALRAVTQVHGAKVQQITQWLTVITP